MTEKPIHEDVLISALISALISVAMLLTVGVYTLQEGASKAECALWQSRYETMQQRYYDLVLNPETKP